LDRQHHVGLAAWVLDDVETDIIGQLTTAKKLAFAFAVAELTNLPDTLAVK
jgi:hypothetical protein